MTLDNKFLILFDGDCNFCNSYINYIIKNDRSDVFRFVSAQSSLGSLLLEKHNINMEEIDSIVLFNQEKFLVKSEAIVFIGENIENKTLGILAVILKFIPLYFRNKCYDFFAKNRYAFFGKKDSCTIPTPEIRRKFLN